MIHNTNLDMKLSLLFFFLCIIAASNGYPVSKPEHMDPTLPPILAGQTPKCTAVVLEQDFGGLVGLSLVSANYTHPRECPYPWTRVVLELSVSATDVRKHRIASVWMDGAEVLRTITPIPMAPGAYWTVQKDVTRHAALVRRLAAMYMKLEDSSNTFSGVYSAKVSLHFYRNSIEQSSNLAVTAHPTIMGLYREPADLILPISDKDGYFGSGFWLKVNDEYRIASSAVKIPTNAYRAVLEVFVSYHDNDENWYTNPLRASYLNHPTNPSTPRTNGGFRQVYATIDGKFVGAHIPFPVIYPASINPDFWSPVASIGAFDMPSYDIDVTPFLGPLLDGREHEFGLGVRDAQPYWLLSGNLHLWIDQYSDSCQGGTLEYSLPPLRIIRVAEWLSADGESEITAEGVHRFVGWVRSSKGNVTTSIQQEVKFATEVEVGNLGSVKQVEVSNTERVQIEVMLEQQRVRRAEFLMDAPMKVRIATTVAPAGGMVSSETKLFHQLEEVLDVFLDSQATLTTRLADRQDAEGSTMTRDGEPLWVTGSMKSQYKYHDDSICIMREVSTEGGVVTEFKNSSCSAVSSV